MKNIKTRRPKSRFLPNGIFSHDDGLDISNKKAFTNRAVFLDRDGTINMERGYIVNPSDIELNPTAGKALRTLNELSILAIVITNQAAIGKKLMSVNQFEKINEKLWADLTEKGAYYDALYYCPHPRETNPQCHCRKPKPGLILQAAKDFKVDLSSSFMIGDKLSDIEAGQSCGCRTIFLFDGHGENAYKDLVNYHGAPPDFICRNLGDAVKWLLQNILNDIAT